MKDQRKEPPERGDLGDPGEKLPSELLWADGGHVSDVVLTALADGQHAIVPAAAHAHVERCTTCMMHLGNSALLSLETRRLLVPARRRVPKAAIALGLVAAVLGLVPRFVDAPDPSRSVSTLAREVAALTAHLDAIPVTVTYVAAFCLVLTGLLFARFSPPLPSQKKEVSS